MKSIALVIVAASAAGLWGYATSSELMPGRTACASLACHLLIAGR